MSNSAGSSPIDGLPKPNALTQALHHSRSNQSSPVTISGASSRFNDSPRSLYGGMTTPSAAGSVSRDSPITTPRQVHTPMTAGSRNPAGPIPLKAKTTDSPPNSAAALAMDKRRMPGQHPSRADGPHMLRTSSMDSTVSSMSSNTTLSQSSAQTDGGASSAEIAALIASAGSAESLIRQLLREKRNAAVQNNQLFKLLNKQKSMMQGMHTDLERALADKERYRNIAQTLHVPVTPEMQHQVRKPSPAISTSSLPSSSSQDRLPIQFPDIGTRHSQDEFARTPGSASATSKDDSLMDQTIAMQQPDSATFSKASTSPTTSEGGDPKRNTVVQVKPTPAPLQLGKTRKDNAGPASPKTPPRTPKSPDIQNDSARASFTARRSMTQRKEGLSNPSSPIDIVATSPSMRKAPPAPLILQKAPEPVPVLKSPEDYGPEDHTDSDYDEIEADELPVFERGRKKTREEDDLEREVLMIRAQRASQSAKSEKSRSKSAKKPAQKSPVVTELPQSPSFKAFSPPGSVDSFQKANAQAPAASIASLLQHPSQNNSQTSIKERTLTMPLKSPGLPMSPRPQDRPINAALPRTNTSGSTSSSVVQSPQQQQQQQQAKAANPAPSGPLPQPPMSAPLHPRTHHVQHPMIVPQSAALNAPIRAAPERPTETASEPRPGAIYRGLMSDLYPDLLLPPNALPSILVRVTSSRLRPSRQSIYGTRASNDDSVFTLGIFARSNERQLWRVEKAAVSLVSLEHQLKQVQPVDVKVPDRSLFSGHAPARVDARRSALENFFETLLDTHMTEKAAVILCRYFSTQVIPAEDLHYHHQHGKESDGSIKDKMTAEVVSKEGYLTKKGKNFGGWKARYFVLNEPVLRYYESPGGSLLGTIKLTNAQIGRQSSHKQRSPSRGQGGDDDVDSQYRHAFLIMEPKRNNSSSQLQHVLCAESDVERDEWVEALMHYLGKDSGDGKVEAARSRSTPSKPEPRENKSILKSMIKDKKERPSDASDNLPEEPLRSVGYNDTAPGQAPVMVGRPVPTSRNTDTPPPPPHTAGSTGAQSSPGHVHRVISGPRDAAPIEDASSWGLRDPQTTGISGPTNGAVITDPTVWGNKPERRITNELKVPDSPRVTEKEIRKRSFWGFGKGHSTHESTNSAGGGGGGDNTQGATTRTAAKPVFGISLFEAVEFCMAPGSTKPLPSVPYRCLEYLEARSAEREEGIFRISGSTLTINRLKERFNTEGDVNLLNDGSTYYDVHAVASLLKLYLRELPERVLTNYLYPKFVAALELNSDEAKTRAFCELVHRLPLPNWTLIYNLCRFLIQVDAASDSSKMTVRNLCIVFAPTLNLSNPIITYFLRDFHDIFDKEPDSSSSSSSTANTSNLTPASATGDDRASVEGKAPSPYSTGLAHLDLDHNLGGGGSGLGLQYEDILQLAHGLNGDDSATLTTSSTRHAAGSGGVNATTPMGMLGGPEYGVIKVQPGTGRIGPGLSAAAAGGKDMRQKRRESSMLMMNFPAPGGHGQINIRGSSGISDSNGSSSQTHGSGLASQPQRKSSVPLLKQELE